MLNFTMIRIKSARPRDVDIVLTFINELENATFDRKRFSKLYLENLSGEDNVYLMAWDGKLAVGFVGCHIQGLLHHNARVAEIQEMFVAENYRNQGIGEQLLESLKKILETKEVHQLEVTSNRKRKSAHHFYLENHFVWTSKKFVCKF